MSARHTTWVGINPEDSFSAENVQLQQLHQELHQEVEKKLDGLEQSVEEAKVLVRKTQSKVDKLEATLDKIEEPDKKS